MNIEEAMQAAVLGDKVTHDGLGPDTFVSYDFRSFKQQHVRHFAEWASCTFIASKADWEADWRIEDRDMCLTCFSFRTHGNCACERKAASAWNGITTPEQAKRLGEKVAANTTFGKLTLDPSKEVRINIRDIPSTPIAAPTETPPYTGAPMDAWSNVAIAAPKRDVWGRSID